MNINQFINPSISFHNITSLYKFISKKRKYQLLIFLLTSFFAAIGESLSIASIIPFLAVLNNPEKLFNLQIVRTYAPYLGISEPLGLVTPFIVIFCLTVSLSGIIRIINLKLSNNISALIGSDLNYECLKKTISQPYKVHIRRNTSEIISTLIEHINVAIIALNSFLQLITSFAIALVLILTICLINFQIAFALFFGISLYYVFIYKRIDKRIKRNSIYNAKVTDEIITITKESLGAYRDVILNNSQNFFLDLFREKDKRKRLFLGDNIYLQAFPKYTLESVGLILIAIISYIFIIKNSTKLDFIPILGSFALAAQKLLPASQSIYSNWINVKSSKYHIQKVLKLLNQPFEYQSNNSINSKNIFNNSIKLENVSFAYKKGPTQILKEINIEIKKNEVLGIIGETGSGKSTLIDIIMGLLEPTSGKILVDDEAYITSSNNWSKNIAHVPQNIFLGNTTVEKNIAFGLNEKSINKELVRDCAIKAKLHSFIKTLPAGYKTFVGENGVKLSGGQKQRIGIARALYKKANILVLDEATSALDSKTEKDFFRNIFKLREKLTIIIISHRPSTLKDCDKIIELQKGKVIKYDIPKKVLG